MFGRAAHGHTPLHPRDGQLLQHTRDLLALSLALDAGRCIRALHVAGMPMAAWLITSPSRSVSSVTRSSWSTKEMQFLRAREAPTYARHQRLADGTLHSRTLRALCVRVAATYTGQHSIASMMTSGSSCPCA